MRSIILVAGLLIFIGAGMWDEVSGFYIFLTLVLFGMFFGFGSRGAGLLSDSFDGDSGSDCGGVDCGGFDI